MPASFTSSFSFRFLIGPTLALDNDLRRFRRWLAWTNINQQKRRFKLKTFEDQNMAVEYAICPTSQLTSAGDLDHWPCSVLIAKATIQQLSKWTRSSLCRACSTENLGFFQICVDFYWRQNLCVSLADPRFFETQPDYATMGHGKRRPRLRFWKPGPESMCHEKEDMEKVTANGDLWLGNWDWTTWTIHEISEKKVRES